LEKSLGVIVTIVIGFFVGLIARFIKPGDDKMGFILTTVLGVAGAMLGSYLGRVFGIYEPNEPAGFIGAVIGAIILLALLKLFQSKRR